ncbi:MAG: glycosyltransferase family 1 protein [Deltaproteobacteria bacterium]|nr:glycosyltransferase family 1 protein [Deltaproteobacteria bacterium]MBW1986362.1 glycosyltransferase family 1 protein [Deltaproteobacteria bacterium]MBW2133755.1 glycosyltransferase family 1 protein [Deltaproteobacteria bacterium]
MGFDFTRKWLNRKPEGPELVSAKPGRPWLLMVTSEKRNQNYYRDVELARRFSTIWISEAFPFSQYGYDLKEIVGRLSPSQQIDWVWVNYRHSFTAKLSGWEELGAPVAAFVGDPHDFIRTEPRFKQKIDFFHYLRPEILINPYPNANGLVRPVMNGAQTPMVGCYWAVPTRIFRPQGRWRRYDIGCLGSHTPGTYPFRNQVREYLLAQRRLKFFKKLRVCGHDGVIFSRALNRLRASFTCASIYQYTLMKYFEIPACGTLLFAEPTPDLEALGFRDGENFVAVNPDNFIEKMEHYLIAAPEEMVRISQAGVELINQRHTWEKRVTGLVRAIARHLKTKWPEDVYQEN